MYSFLLKFLMWEQNNT